MFHFRAISSSRIAAATVALALATTACSDLTIPSAEIVGIADLLILPQQQNAPQPAPASFWVSNSRQTVRRINHPDNFNTLYLEMFFPVGSMTSLDGSPLSNTDSLYITVDPRPGAYGFTVSPAGITFASNAAPEATFSFSVYADASVANTSPTYANSAGFIAALQIWREATVDEWRVASGSRLDGVDAVSANLQSSGRFLLAARR